MFSGSIVALITPMDRDGTIDFVSFDKLLDMHLAAHTDGVVIAGTTGESATLLGSEYQQLIRRAVKRLKGQCPVIAGVSGTHTETRIQSAKTAMEAGADASLLVTPPYVKPTQEGLFQHYQAIAQAVPMPHILYNVPGRTACDLLPETVYRLSHIANIVGIKEATGDIERTSAILARCRTKLDVYSGDDLTALACLSAGAKGVISVTANVAPALMHEMCSAALANDWPLAHMINRRLNPLHHALFCESNPIPAKWALHDMGLIPAGIRLPLTALDAQYHPKVRKAIHQANPVSTLEKTA